MIRMNSDKKNRMIRMNSDKKNGISISTTINCNYNVVITNPTFNFSFALFTKIRNRKTVLCLRVKCLWSWLHIHNKQSQHTSFQKSMPKMWKACLLQSYFGNPTRMSKAAARCPILQNSNFLMFLELRRYAIFCSCCLFCYS